MQIRTIRKRGWTVAAIMFVAVFGVGAYGAVSAVTVSGSTNSSKNGRLITIHDRGQEQVVLSTAGTVQEALVGAGISLTSSDIVEPARDHTLIATDYTVNLYRARPVIVQDGSTRQKIMTAAQTPLAIAADAGMTLRSEDGTTLSPSSDIAADGATTLMTIDRSVSMTLMLYGKPTQVFTRADTVAGLLEEKGITLQAADTLSRPLSTAIVEGLSVELWRDGVQAVTLEEPVPFSSRTTLDADLPAGTRSIKTPGVNGTKQVVYEITAIGGKESSRKVIQSVTVTQPQPQVEVIGTKPGPNALTRSKGAQQFRDSKGVSHRETYYDLPMNVVMNACGGGSYTVRPDGAKIDRDGFILVAAHLGNYPRCSIVETSMGPGKVYDTGGFTAKHPHGFDLATDWTNNDGR